MICLKGKKFVVLALMISLTTALVLIANVEKVYMLQKLGILLKTQKEWVSGAKASIQVLTVSSLTRKPVKSSVELKLLDESKELVEVLFKGETNEEGLLNLTFDVPNVPSGNYFLLVKASSGLSSDERELIVPIKASYRILITTDKPVYKPGQTVMFRA